MRSTWRRMCALGVLTTALGCLFTLPASATSTNLIQNGGFEQPVVPTGSYQSFSHGTSFDHWQVAGVPDTAVSVVNGHFTEDGFAFPTQSGKQWLDLTGVGSNSAEGVTQTFDTTQGSRYTLTFWVGNVYDPSGGFGVSSTVKVLRGSSTLITATNSGGVGLNKLVWKKFSKSFTAESARTTLSFINEDPSSDNSNGLDSVSVVG